MLPWTRKMAAFHGNVKFILFHPRLCCQTSGHFENLMFIVLLATIHNPHKQLLTCPRLIIYNSVHIKVSFIYPIAWYSPCLSYKLNKSYLNILKMKYFPPALLPLVCKRHTEKLTLFLFSPSYKAEWRQTCYDCLEPGPLWSRRVVRARRWHWPLLLPRSPQSALCTWCKQLH